MSYVAVVARVRHPHELPEGVVLITRHDQLLTFVARVPLLDRPDPATDIPVAATQLAVRVDHRLLEQKLPVELHHVVLDPRLRVPIRPGRLGVGHLDQPRPRQHVVLEARGPPQIHRHERRCAAPR
ncbi:hypothetical protein [Sorangium sp. So ce381]|uniref:hypothetical protein n=1 Tax=Sorangium sp. So ce381 TaxID=3133307 RepID=UPI003F5C0388